MSVIAIAELTTSPIFDRRLAVPERYRDWSVVALGDLGRTSEDHPGHVLFYRYANSHETALEIHVYRAVRHFGVCYSPYGVDRDYIIQALGEQTAELSFSLADHGLVCQTPVADDLTAHVIGACQYLAESHLAGRYALTHALVEATTYTVSIDGCCYRFTPAPAEPKSQRCYPRVSIYAGY